MGGLTVEHGITHRFRIIGVLPAHYQPDVFVQRPFRLKPSSGQEAHASA